jgi:hypothetical protein
MWDYLIVPAALVLIAVACWVRGELWGIGGHHKCGSVKRQCTTGLCHPDCARCARDRADPEDKWIPEFQMWEGK